MKKIALMTSGGDAPGMNACIRAVVRTAAYKGIEVIGFYRGYEGMIDNDFVSLASHDVANILQRGGTILKSARSKRFMEKEYRKIVGDNLRNLGVDGLICIGGDGTFRGANALIEEEGIPVIGIPGTIDNDMYGTDFTIGYDTAINTVVSAVDKIRDTAASHNRLFIVEVMGKDAGFIALRSGIGTGAEAILVPEEPTLIDSLISKLESGRRANKMSGIIIVAEGDDAGGAQEVAHAIQSKFDHYEIRVSILGHMQRGGSPSAMDRVIASRMGNAAVDALVDGKSNLMVGIVNSKIKYTDFSNAVKHHKSVSKDLLNLAKILAI